MKKFLFAFFLLLSVSLFSMSKDKSTFNPDDDDVIEIDVNYTPPVTGPKRTPAVIPISATYYATFSCIEVCFLYNIGDVDIVITNITSGSSSFYNIHSFIGSVVIPFYYDYGSYCIEFSTESGAVYSGLFTLE